MKYSNENHVAAFGEIVGICNELGAAYTPGSESLKLTAIGSQLEQAKEKSKAVKDAYAAFTLAMNTRREQFNELTSFAARVVRYAGACRGSEEDMVSLKTLKRKLQTPSTKMVPDIPIDQKEAKPIRRMSHQDFVSKQLVFANLIRLLEGMPEYTPSEAAFTIASLKAKAATLQSLTESVVEKRNQYNHQRIVTKLFLYGKGGVQETALAVKNYLYAVYGYSSETSKAAKKVKITGRKVK